MIVFFSGGLMPNSVHSLYPMYVYVHSVNVRAFVGAWMVQLVQLVQLFEKPRQYTKVDNGRIFQLAFFGCARLT